MDTANNRIKIFVSSCMKSERFMRVRAQIEQELKKNDYIDPYIFEFTGASSTSSEDDYRLRIRDSDLCIFIIDDEFQVTSGVRNELDEATANNKKCLYYFYKNNPNCEIPLQTQLRGPRVPKTYEVKSLDQLPGQISRDIRNEIVIHYHEYCCDWLIYNTDGLSGLQQASFDAAQFLGPQKIEFGNFPATKNFLSQFVFGIRQQETSESEFDEYVKLICEMVLTGKSIRRINISLLLDEIQNRVPSEFFETISHRWKGIQHYWKNDKAASLSSFQQALIIAKEAGLPDWFIYDMLIDLRNISNEMNNLTLGLEYQQQIDNIKTIMVYPLMDRANGDMRGELTKELIKTRERNSHAVIIGSDITRFVSGIAKMTAIASLFGSWTYLRLLPEKLGEILSILLVIHDSLSIKEALLKLKLAKGKHKDTFAYLSANSSLFCGISQVSAQDIYSYVRETSSPLNNNAAIYEAFSWLGSYLTDIDFENARNDIVSMVEAELETNPRPTDNLFQSLSANCWRLDEQWLLEVCCKAIEKGRNTYWRTDAMKLAARGFNLDSSSRDLADRFLNDLKCALQDEEHDFTSLSRALLRTEALSTSFQHKIGELLDMLPDFYRVESTINQEGENQEQLIELVNKKISSIRKDNQNQGKNGAFSFAARDSFEVLSLSLDQISTDNDNLRREALYAAFETLCTEKQLTQTKQNALIFLINQVATSSSGCEMAQDMQHEKIEIHPGCSFGNYSAETLHFGKTVLEYLIGFESSSQFRLEISRMYPKSDFEKIESMRILEQVISNRDALKDDLILKTCIVSYLQAIASAEKRELRHPAFRLLSLMANDGNLGRDVQSFLLQAFPNEQPAIKIEIINAVKDLSGAEMSETAQKIITAGESDANYHVRMACSEVQQA